MQGQAFHRVSDFNIALQGLQIPQGLYPALIADSLSWNTFVQFLQLKCLQVGA